MEPKEQRKVDDFIVFAMCAARQALDDAGWRPIDYDDQVTTGVMIGSGIGGIEGIAETAIMLKERGPRRVSPFFIPGRLINLASGYVSIEFGLKGPNHAVVTACSTGSHAIGDAGRLIALGDADVMVAGGAESPVNRLSIAGFAACRALSTGFNDTPTRASRPYDRDRDGFVMGEGAGCVVLEEYEHAKRRGAKIYAELIGYGLSGDAYHITAPAEDGDGAYRCMAAAIRRAGIAPAGDRLHQRPRHLDAARRRDRAQGGRARRRQCGGPHLDVVDQVVDRPPAGRRRGGRGDLLGARDSRPGCAADHQPRQSVGRHAARSRAAPGAQARHRGGAVEFVRLRRHQCVAGVPPRRKLTKGQTSYAFRHICALTCCDGRTRPTCRWMRHECPRSGRGPSCDGPQTVTARAPRAGGLSASSPRSPRAALEPERLSPSRRASKRARHPIVVVGNASSPIIVLVALVGRRRCAVGKQRFEAAGPLDRERIVNIPRGSASRTSPICCSARA